MGNRHSLHKQSDLCNQNERKHPDFGNFNALKGNKTTGSVVILQNIKNTSTLFLNSSFKKHK